MAAQVNGCALVRQCLTRHDAVMKKTWPAPERNKGPIVDVLRRVLPKAGRVLEISSGSGQHVVHFARQLPGLVFQPSDVDPDNLASIRAWRHDEQLANVLEPVRLDVLEESWPVGPFDAAFNANMIHIAPWACAEGLFRGVGRHLGKGGVFVLYGPFRIGGAHTAESNAEFDADLRQRDPAWGVRDLEAVEALAREQGLELRERVPMPANNQCLVFVREG
jgi:SAM-dependent methyltransferase